MESIIEKEKKKLFEQKDYLASLGFILTDKSSERMAKLIHYIKTKVIVLLEGPTGTSKTRTTLIAYKYIQHMEKLNKSKHKKHHNDDDDENENEEKKELIRFNLSAETKVDDLIAKYTGDPQSPAGLKIENGPFFRAFTQGNLLLLDEINLAPSSVLQCIQQALDSKILSLEIPGRPLQQYEMHENFSLIATQNPNTGAFANKRQDLGIEFLSRFQKICFPEFEPEELKDIAIGLAECNKYIKKIDNKTKDKEKEEKSNDEKKKIVNDIVNFHINWKEANSSSDDVQCFTIREIEAAIKAIAEGKSIYNTLLTIYGARYKKEKRKKLIETFNDFETLKDLKPEPLIMPKEFQKCFENKSLVDVVNAVDFSLENERNVIIVGKEESGITQIARWCAEYFYSKKNKGQKSSGAFYLCTKNIQCSDLIGVQKPSGKMDESNELLEWKNGFLSMAIEKGDCVVLDSIDEAPSTLTERLNGLLDKKNDDSERKFDVPENPKQPQIDIHENFRMICTSNINKINEMSPAFVNRFDVIVLEDQLEDIGDKINDLIKYFLNRCSEEKISEEKEQKEILKNDEFGFGIDENEEQEEQLDAEEEKQKAEEFDQKLIDLIKKKFYELNDRNSEKINPDIKNVRTISNLSKLCRGIYRLDKMLKENKRYKNIENGIPMEEVAEFIFTLLFAEDENKIIISDKIMDILGNELKEQNNKNLKEKYFFENSKTLTRFMVIVYASSCFNNHLCVIGPPGAGKTTAARAFAELLRNIRGNLNKEPFYIHTFHQGTRATDFYGSTTIVKKSLEFKDGHLTLSLKEGNVFIADEFNISSVANMKSVTPVLEQIFEEKCLIPGIDGEIKINRNFFFIICQNEMCTFGRNDLPEKIKSKVRILLYPPQTGEELQDICRSIYNSLDTSQKKNNSSDAYKKAKLCGMFLDKINKKSIITKWSLRDIYKLFNRILKQHRTPGNYHGIDFEHHILFYVMSSVEEGSKEKVLDDLVDVIGEVFKLGEKKKELIEIYKTRAELKFGTQKERKDEGISSISVFIRKKSCEIYYRDLVKTKGKIKDDFTESILGLHNLLEGLFNILISHNEEPILIAGETSFKTYLAQLCFKDDRNSYEIVSLNQESTIPQLLGSSSFFTPEEAKKFYLKQLCNLFNENNPIKYLNLLDDWEGNKEEIKKYVDERTLKIDKNTSFDYAIEHLSNLLFNEKKNSDENNIINMSLEFLPGLFLSAILRKKSLILKNLPNVPTVVLERFNELFSGVHILTLVEDIQNTFTKEGNKELKISNNFRVIATCKPEKVNNLSEALLSRFTIIYTSAYDENEEKRVLKSDSNLDSMIISKLIEQYKLYFTEQSILFNLSQMIACKKIVSKMDHLINDHEKNIRICLYTLIKGFHENRTNEIEEIKQKFEVSFIPSIEGESPFEYVEKNNEIRLMSKLTKLSMHAIKKGKIENNEPGIAFTSQFIEIIDTILFGLSTSTPVILEGNYGQGKKTAISYVANKLGLEMINIVISNSTKVEDLLCKTIIDKDENKDIIITTSKTKLYEAIECKEIYPKTLVVLDGINNASPAVLETLSSIFGAKGTTILLPNGAVLEKGNLNLIGIFNKGKDSTREKLPTSIIYNSIYLVVDDPTPENIKKIIEVLFIQNKLENEIEKFQYDFIKAKNISNEVSGELPLTLNEIKKYLNFRINIPQLNKSIFLLFIFAYHFSEKSNRDKVINELKLDKLAFNPEIKYDGSNKFFKFKTSKGETYDEIKVDVYSPKKIKRYGAKNLELLFDSLTISEKYCILLLICSLKANKTIILEGATASGKSYIILQFSLILGQKLNIYQMNSNSGMSILTGQSIIKPEFDADEIDLLKKTYKSIKSFFTTQYNPKRDYKKILKSIEYKLKHQEKYNYTDAEIEKLKKASKIFFKTTSPPSRFSHQESVFTISIENGEWVVLDGIEMAPCIISEKIASLCGDEPELNIFESGKGIYFSKNPKNKNTKKIHENFHLFITYNPNTKGVILLDQSLFNKCVLFTLPQIDDSARDASTMLYNSLETKINPDLCVELAARLTNSHMKAAQISKLNTENFAGGIPFTARNLLFISKEYNSRNEPPSTDYEVADLINSCLELYYINSFIKTGQEKENFSKLIKATIKEKPKFKPDTKKSTFEIYNNIVMFLIKIQNACEGEYYTDFNFKEFIQQCMEVKIEEIDIDFIIINIQDTLNLLDYSKEINQDQVKHFKEQFYQIHIVKDLLKEIKENLKDVASTQKDLKLNDPDLLKINSLRPILLRLKLLINLLESEKSFATLFKTELLNDKAELIINVINDMKNYKDKFENESLKNFENAKDSFFNLIAVLYKEPSLLNMFDMIFPYSQFSNKESPLYLAGFYLKAWNTLAENKINFTIITPKYKYNFIYEKFQFNRIYPIFDFNESNSLLLSTNTSILVNESSTNKINNKSNGVILKRFKDPVNLKNTLTILSLINKLSNEKEITHKMVQDHFKIEFQNSETIQEENLSKNLKLISKNLFFSDDTNEISRMWGLIYNLNNNQIMLDYLRDNFYEVERDTYLVVNQFYKNINDEESIDKYCKFSHDLEFFLNNESRLWKYQIGEKIEEKEYREYYEYLIKEIDNEMQNFEKLRGYWPQNILDNYFLILEEIRNEVKVYLKKDEEDEILNQLKEKFDNLNKKIKKFLQTQPKDENQRRILKEISDKIVELSQNPTESLYKKLENQVNIIFSLNKSLLSTNIDDVQWPQNPLVDAIELKDDIIKMLNIIIWYSDIADKFNSIFDPYSSEHKIMNILIQLGNIPEISSISKFINEKIFGFQKEEGVRISEKEKKLIFQMLRGQFIFKFLGEELKASDLISFVPYLNNLSKRTKITKQEFFYGFELTKKLDKNFKIIFPKFEPIDILYVFIEYDSDNKFIPSNLFKMIGFNFRAQDIVDIKSDLEKKEKMIDIWTLISVDLYMNITNDKEIPVNETQKIKEYLYKKIVEMNSNKKKDAKTKEILTRINTLFNCAKYCEDFDEVIQQHKNNPDLLRPKFDDYKSLKKENDKPIDVISYLFKKNLLNTIHPFLLYFLVKYKNCCQSLFNSLKKEDFDKLFIDNIDYIPAWALILRLLSSSHIILYDDNNILKKEIEDKVKEKIISLVKENEEIKTDWLNLMIERIPSEILNDNIHIFYQYFKNLVGKLKISNNKIKNIIKDILKEFYFNLIDNAFTENTFDDFIKLHFNYEYNDDDDLMINMFKKPSNYIFNRIKKICSEKQLNFANNFQSLYDKINKFNSYLPELKSKITESYNEINNIKLANFKYSQDNKKNLEINAMFESISLDIKKYNTKIDDLIKSTEIQISNVDIDKLIESSKTIKSQFKVIKDSEICIDYLKIPVKNNEDLKKIFYDDKEIKFNSKYIYLKNHEIDDDFISKFRIELKIIDHPLSLSEEKKKVEKGEELLPTAENEELKKMPLANMDKEEVSKDNKKINNIKDILIFNESELLTISKLECEEEELKEKIKIKLGPASYLDPPIFYFKSSPIKDFFSKLEKIKMSLEHFQLFIDDCKKGNRINDQIIEEYNSFSLNLKDLLKDCAIEDKDITEKMTNLLMEIDNSLIPIDNDLELFNQEFKDELWQTIKDFNEINDETFIFSVDCSLPSEPFLSDKYLPINFKNLNDSDNDFSLPIISENKKENRLQCSYDKLIQEIGPICPLFYSKPIKINFLLFIDDDLTIKVQNLKEDKEEKDIEKEMEENLDKKEKEKKEGENDKKKEDNEGDENINFNILENDEIIEDYSEYVKVTEKIKKEDKNILIQIKIPNAKREDKEERHIIPFILHFESIKGLKLNLECKITVKTIPIKSLLSCEKYQLIYKDKKFYLNTDKLFSGEEINFMLTNYPKSSLSRFFCSRIVALENNSAEQPKFSKENNNEVALEVPKFKKTHESQIPRLNCLFELVLNENYKIPIIIDCIIIPIEFSFEIYDYYNKNFVNGDIPVNIYASEEILNYKRLSLDLIFKINFPIKDLNIKGDINVNYNYNLISILPKEKTKSFIFKLKEHIIKYNLTIEQNFSFPYSSTSYNDNYNSKNNNYYNKKDDNKYIEFILNINNITKKIKLKILEAPKIEDQLDMYINKFGLYKVENNLLNKISDTFNYQQGDTYISPFYSKQSQIKIDYSKSKIKGNDPTIKAEIIIIRSDGELYTTDDNEFNLKNKWYYWYDYIPIIGLYLNKWIPLLTKFECSYRQINLERKKYFELSEIHNEIINNNPNDYEFLTNNSKKKLQKYKTEYNSAKNDRKKSIQSDYIQILNDSLYNYIKENFSNMNINKNNFIFIGFLLNQYPEKIIGIIENKFPQEISKGKNILELIKLYQQLKIRKNADKEITLCLHNLFVELYKAYKNKYEEIKNNNNTIFLSSINAEQLLKINDEYYKYNKPENNNFSSLYQLSNDIEKFLNQLKKSKQIPENSNKNEQQNKDVKTLISHKYLIIGDKATILEKEDDKETIKESKEKENNFKTEAITISLPEITYDKNEISLQYLMHFYSRCTLGTRVFPTFIKNAVTLNNLEDIKIAQNYITNLYYYFKTKPLKSEKDYSIISSKTNEFFDAFKIMIGKMKKSNISFASIKELNDIEIDKTRMNSFISLEEDKSIELRPDKWNKKKPKELQVLQQFEDKLSRNINYAAGTASTNRTLSINESFFTKNVSNVKKEDIKKDDPNSTILDLGKDKVEKEKTDKLITKVFIKKSEIKDRKPKAAPDSKKKMGFIEDDTAKKERKIFSREDFNKVKFKEEDDIADLIEEMENVNETSKFHFEKSKNPNEGYGLPKGDLLKSLPLEKDQHYPIHQILEDSSFLTSQIISNVSLINLTNEIPFRDIEANILLDCTRTISDENKLFMLLITCGLTSALNSLEIPYCVSLIGDSSFKIIIKSFEEPHSEEVLQRIMECIFISRYKTDLATCLKYSLDKFPHNFKNRVFYIITNGMDPELRKINRWKEAIFNSKENSFSFIFIESRVLKPKQKQYLTEEVWNPFREKIKDSTSLVTSTEISIQDIGNYEEFNPIETLAKCISESLIRQKTEENEIFEATPVSFTTEQYKMLDMNLLSNISMFLGEELKRFTNIYYAKKILPNLTEPPEKISNTEYKNLVKNIGGVIVYNDLSKEIKDEVLNLQRNFKVKREKINLSVMEYIFKPNLPTQPVLTDDGTHIDVNELIKYFLNPTPNPKIYREIRDGLVKNYGVTVVVDVSNSCLCDISFMHSVQTVRMLISSIGAIDIPCFDLIMVGDPEPVILCSERATNEILSEKSNIWGPFFSFFKPKRHGDLASAIKAAYDLNSARRTEHTNRIFVCTDGLYSKFEREAIIKYVNYCMAKGVLVYGIGIGICAYGIEEIFPNIIYSLNPGNLLQAISKCFSDSSVNKNNKMPTLTFPQKFSNVLDNIKLAKENKYFKELKKELNDIMVSNDAFPFSNEAIEIDFSQGRENPSTGITEMYKKDLLKGQKILIVMCYTCELNSSESSKITSYYIDHCDEGEECIKTAVQHYGIELDIVTNYIDAINKLTHQSKEGYCDYYAVWVLSGRPYEEMPEGADPGYVIQFIKVLNIFWKNGGSIVFCSDNQPFTFQTNLFLEQMVLPNGDKVSFRIGGNHPGEQILEADDSGLLEKKKTFNTKVQPTSRYERKSFANNLYQIYEGKTISFIGTGNLWDEKSFNPIDDPKLLLPFVPFSRDSDGGINSIFYAGEDGYGDLVFDNSYTKFFLEMKECGTFRYVQNVAAWTAAPERCNVIYGVKPRDYRPKAVIYELTGEKFTDFQKPPLFDLVFMIDATGSMGGSLNMATKYCIDIWNALKVKMPGVHFKFGGIFYRDPIDSSSDINEYIDLTDNINEFKDFLSKMEPKGGGDTPEDWVGGYNIALNNKKIHWRKGVRCIIHIADAGAHGTKYSSGDKHPEQGPLLDNLIPKCVGNDFQIIAFNIGTTAVNSFNEFKKLYLSYGGKQYTIKEFDQHNDVGEYFTKLVIGSVSSCA